MYKSDTQEYYSIVTCNICCVVLWWKCKYSYTYDAIGNPTTYRGASLAFNGRQLTSYNDGTNSIAYTYDASGLRASKTVNGETTVYQYVGDKLYYEQRPDGSKMYYFYDSYGNLAKIYRHTSSTTKKIYNVVTNAQGDVTAIYDFYGVLVCTYEYDAWGNLTFARDSAGNIITSQNHIAFLNPIRYRGYYFDNEIGMYYLQSRYYDPDTGRFINADGYITTGQGVLSYNMFAYCLNNPVMLSDPSGEYSEEIGQVAVLVGIIMVKYAHCFCIVSGAPMTEEQKNFVAVIAGESLGNGEMAHKAVAHTIMNRYKEPRETWSHVKSVSDVLVKKHYNAVGGDQYNLCLEYLNNRDGSNEVYEELIAEVMPIYFGLQKDFTGGAHYIFRVDGSQDLYNALLAQPERYIKLPSVPGLDSSLFCMFRCEY